MLPLECQIAASVSHTIDGKPSRPPVFVPRPIPGLVSKRVLVMEFVKGIPLNRLKEKMEEKGIAEVMRGLLGFYVLQPSLGSHIKACNN